MATELVQIFYEESQKAHLYPFAVPYYNGRLTVFFENEVIKELVPRTTADKIGICSWKLHSKLRWYIGRHRDITQELLETDFEVMPFTRNTDEHDMFGAAERWHPGFLKTFDMIMSEIGAKRPLKVIIPIYQNHFCAKTVIYKDYVKRYLIPAMSAIENNEGLRSMAMVDAKYSQLTRENCDHLKAKIGIGYYPMIPFLLERLFSVYVQNEGIKVTWL